MSYERGRLKPNPPDKRATMSEGSVDRSTSLSNPLSIAGWYVDVSTHRLLRGQEVVKLEPRTMALLTYLADRPQQAVTREELEREVWRGMVVGYDALSNAIAKLRRAFGDDPKQPRLIETIPKVGYRLIAEVEVSPPTPVLSQPQPSLERKLAAILYADVAGYSRLTGEDEKGTHRALSAHLDLLTASIQNYGGRVVNFAGDAVLADFTAVSSALSCAIAAQEKLVARNDDMPDGRKVQFRIGVNLGEVIVDRNDIYGDGVNVAARLESLAEPGGVCLSGAVFDAIGHQLPLDYHFLGEQNVKNIAKPIRGYHARLRPGAVLPAPAPILGQPRRFPRRFVAGAVAALIVAAVAVSIWIAQRDAIPPPEPTRTDDASIGDRPTVAVLPFDNLSQDPAHDVFADGMTSDLITELSKVSGLFVISRHSVFAYKGKSKPLTQIAEELGVRYLVVGSVQRAESRIRINAQLIDGSNGANKWAERYDGAEAEVFSLQDQVVADIVETLEVKLTDAERGRLGRPRTGSLEAHDLYTRAEYSRLEGDYGVAIKLYQQAVALDSDYTDGYAGIAQSALELLRWNTTSVMSGPTARRTAYETASRVLAVDESDPRAFAVLAIIQSLDGRHSQAIESARRAVSLDPNSADALVALARVLSIAGEHAEAEAAMETAFRLSPHPPADYYGERAIVAFFLRDYEKAVDLLMQMQTGAIVYYQRWLAMSYAELGRDDEVGAALAEVLDWTPFSSLAYYRTLFAHYKRDEDLEHVLDAMKKAGIPEWPYGFRPEGKHQLNSQSLRAITIGHTWTGRDSNGASFIQQFSDDGRVAFRDPSSLLTGTVQFKKDLLRVEYPAELMGREDCGYVYRNQDGTVEDQNEYVRVSLGGIYYFSVAP